MVLRIDDATRAEVNKVLAYAHDHPYMEGNPVPGSDENYVAKLGSYRAVFTFTKQDGIIFRHLSISMNGYPYPDPMTSYVIASLFGFTGWCEGSIKSPSTWFVKLNELENCVTLIQMYTREQ